MLMASFLTGDYQLLSLAMQDRLHQPYRLPLVPGLNEVMSAVLAHGALGSCLRRGQDRQFWPLVIIKLTSLEK